MDMPNDAKKTDEFPIVFFFLVFLQYLMKTIRLTVHVVKPSSAYGYSCDFSH